MNITSKFKYTDNDTANLLIHTYAQTYLKYHKVEPGSGEFSLNRSISALDKVKYELEQTLSSMPESSKLAGDIKQNLEELDKQVKELSDGMLLEQSKERNRLHNKLTEIGKKLQNVGVHFNDQEISFDFSRLDFDTDNDMIGTTVFEALVKDIEKQNSDESLPDIPYHEFNGVLHFELPHGSPFEEKALILMEQGYFKQTRAFPEYDLNDSQYLHDVEALGDNTIFAALCQDLIEQRPDLEKRYNKSVEKEKSKSMALEV